MINEIIKNQVIKKYQENDTTLNVIPSHLQFLDQIILLSSKVWIQTNLLT